MTEKIKISVSEPTTPEPKKSGLSEKQFREIMKDPKCYFTHSYGGFDESKAQSKKKCPYFDDYIGYKSFTIVVGLHQQTDAEYWCEYFHGANSVSKVKKFAPELPGPVCVAIRSNYMCW